METTTHIFKHNCVLKLIPPKQNQKNAISWLFVVFLVASKYPTDLSKSIFGICFTMPAQTKAALWLNLLSLQKPSLNFSF